MIDVPALRQKKARRTTVFAGIPLAALFAACAVHYSHPLSPALPAAGNYIAAVQNSNWRQEASLSGSPATTRVWQKLVTERGPILSCDLTGLKTYNIAFVDTHVDYIYVVQSARGHTSVAVTLTPGAGRDWQVSQVAVLPASERRGE